MILEDQIQAERLRAFGRAGALSSVTAVRRGPGCSQARLDPLSKRQEPYRVDGPHSRRTQTRAGGPRAVAAPLEGAVIAPGLACPPWGARRLSVQLARQEVQIAPGAVARTLRRLGLGGRIQRLEIRDHPIEISRLGALVGLGGLYAWTCQDLGWVWRITACDTTTSYGVAAVLVMA